MAGDSVRRVSQNTLLLLAGTIFRMVLSLALVVFAAARLGVEQFGSYSLGVLYFELCLSLSATAASLYLTRELAKHPERAGQLLASAVVLVLALAALFSLGLNCAAPWLGYSLTTRAALAIGCVALAPATLTVIAEAAFIAQERAAVVSLGTALESVLRLGLSFAALLSGGGVRALFMALVAARIVQALYYWRQLQTAAPLRFTFTRSEFGDFLRHWKIFAAENWLATINANLAVLALSVIKGEAAVGIYDAAYKLIRLGIVVARSYTTAVFPLMSRLAIDSREAFLRLSGDSLRYMLAVAAPVGVGVTVFAQPIIGLLYESDYAAAAPVLAILVWVLLLDCVNPFLSYTLFAQGRQNRSMHVAAISLAVNLLATPWLVSRYGPTGAALGALAAGLVAAACYASFSLPLRNLQQFGWTTLKVAGAGLACLIALRLVLPSAWVGAIVAGVLVYLAALVLLKIVTPQDWRALRNAGGPA